jgi:hypothetical protein
LSSNPNPHPPFRLELSAAVKAAEDAGYEVIGDPVRHPKHFELLVRRDAAFAELHVGTDGDIGKVKPAEATDRKWRNVVAENSES